MGTSRTGAAGAASRIQVSRTGRPRRRLGRGAAPLFVPSSPPLDEILLGDCIAALERLPPESVDLVFADPPYNLQLESALTRPDQSLVDAVDDDWDKFASFSRLRRLHPRLAAAACRRVMKKNATLWVIGSYHNIFRVGATLQDLGFWILNDIVWRKANPMPNFRGRRFTNAHETLIWAVEERRREGLHLPLRGAEGRQRRPADALRLVHPALHRRGAAEGRGRPQGASDAEARGAARPRAAGRVQSRRRGARSLLRHRHDRRRRQAARPPLHRHRARPGLRRGRPRAHRRRRAARRTTPIAAPPAKRAEPRVPFLVARRGAAYVSAGRDPASTSAAATRRSCAPTAPSRSARSIGSIHKIGALAQGLPACNGWTFWHAERKGRLVCIDEFRAKVRAELALRAERHGG